MWSSETEKATEWDLFLPCRATCKVRIPRDSGEKKPTKRSWFFNDWWWVWTRFQNRAYRALLVSMVSPRMAAESNRQLSLPRRCPQLSGAFRSFLADQFTAVFRLKAGDPVMAKSPDRWVFHKVGDIHRCYRKPEEVLSDPMNHQVGRISPCLVEHV